MDTEHLGEQLRNRSLFGRPNVWVVVLTFVSVGIGIFGVVLTFLTLQEPETHLTFEIINDTNVLDVRRPLADLKVVFRGKDVQEDNLNLRILTINVVNSGEVNILPGHYDQEDDWGMRFAGAEILEARLLDASSDYLQSRVVPQRSGVDAIVFPKLIFEKDAFFVIEILLLHSKEDRPAPSPIGKIAGIDNIVVLTRSLARQEPSFVAELFSGSALVQLVRTIIYLGGLFMVMVVGVVMLVGLVLVRRSLNKRRRRTRA